MESLQSGDEKADGKKSILLSIGGGTVFYMLLVQFVFCK